MGLLWEPPGSEISGLGLDGGLVLMRGFRNAIETLNPIAKGRGNVVMPALQFDDDPCFLKECRRSQRRAERP